ncbi:serine/threonine protein kinase [Stigmatella aurantiaca]|uniref:Serine/threonine protein kinase n=1 Tax=Stigmatella aurantiaca TaxID=41 RepID=A0A1H7QJI6_STIAU|nr:serine/threonine-protein kinase [Stigmatella aurantiaca]SEL47755.1 serine/threonine protein kinase [Stigmatella aurantiaca]
MNERYRLVRPLATGGMAELFLGIAQGAGGFEKPVAIKRMRPHLAQDEGLVRMFLAEARLATHLHHQNIATVYDVGTHAAGLFLVMELVNGWDLGRLMRHAARRGQRLPPHLVAFIGAQVLAGLIHAYRRTHQGRPVLTAHRDISPSNILVSREGEVKLTDFGIAKREGISHGTEPGVFKGKPSYATPETVRGEPATAASDQFSLGLVLHELLGGVHPFHDAVDPMAVAIAIATRPPPPLPDAPPPLAEVVMRALSPQPEARFPQPEAMAEALARYLSRAGEPATSNTLAAFIAGLELPPTLLEQGEPLAPEMNATTLCAGLAPLQELSQGFAIHAEPLPLLEGLASRPIEQVAREAPATAAAPETQPGLRQAQEALLEAPEASQEPLELVERSPSPLASARTQAVPEGTAERRAPARRWKGLLGAGVLLAAGLAGAGLWRPGILSREQAITFPSLSVVSQPEGARVLVEGVDQGKTPLVMDNTYPPGSVSVQLTLPGYKPWKGTFTGGASATLDVRLQKR